jgi:GT2 family glycosyltransferase
VDCVQGALVLLTRAALDAGVRFNEDLFAYVDEIDLGLQAARAGLRAYVDPRVEVRHKVRHGPLSPTEGYLILRNRWYVVRRWGRWHHRAVCLLSLGVGDLPYRCLRRTLQGHGRYARACFLGLWDGLRGKMGPGRIGRL